MLEDQIVQIEEKENNFLFSPGIEPGTFCVLDRCDNHYTTKTRLKKVEGKESYKDIMLGYQNY